MKEYHQKTLFRLRIKAIKIKGRVRFWLYNLLTKGFKMDERLTEQEIEKKRKKLLALGKDPKFVEMLLKGAVEPKRMF